MPERLNVLVATYGLLIHPIPEPAFGFQSLQRALQIGKFGICASWQQNLPIPICQSWIGSARRL